jgi:hypothetical protein
MVPRYEDFFLIVDGTPGNYTVEAQGPGEIRVPPVSFEYDETKEVRIELNRIKEGFAPDRRRMQSVGELLFNALFPRRVIRAFERAPDALPQGVSLRVKLIVRPAELGHLPWELLYDPDQEVFLAARLSYPIVRFIESGTPVASLLARHPLRVLYLQANPKGTTPLDTAASEKALREALGDDGAVTSVRNTTPAALRDVLRESKFHVLHYDGHGAFDEASGRGRLYLHDEQDRSHPLDGEMLATYLDGSSIRLVVLSACETAVDSEEKRFSGIAQQLMRTTRLPAVVAMQYEIPDASAIAFTREFYKALVDDYPVDAAVVEGRKAVLETLGSDPFSQPDWATPVLFMRVKDGDILREEAPAPELEPSTAGTVERKRRFEAAMPQTSQVGRVTEIRVMVALPDSKGLRAHLPDWTAADDLIARKDVTQDEVPVDFPVDPETGDPLPIDMFVHVAAPGFEMEEKTKKIHISPAHDSGTVTFFLTPREGRKRGRVRVELFKDEELTTLVGSLTLLTEVKSKREELAKLLWAVATFPFSFAFAAGAQPPEPTTRIDTGGGAYIGGNVQVGGEFVGRDKVVHGDEVRGDKIEGHVGDVGTGAQVAIGKRIDQTIAQAPTALTAAERLELERLMAELKGKLASLDIPETKKLLGLEFVGQLEEELTRTEEPPDASTIKVAGDWLLKNIPALTGTLASLFVNPIVGKVVEAAGDLAAKWVKERLGTRIE